MRGLISLIFIMFICYAIERRNEEKNREKQEKLRQEMGKRKKISEDYKKDYKENYTENYTENYIENYKENYKENYTGKTPCIHTNVTKNSRVNIDKPLYQDDPIKNIEETKSTFESEDDDDAIKYL